MERQPFTVQEPRRRTLLQRLLRRHPRENAPIAVNNLLADAPRPRHVSIEEVQRICATHRVELHGRLQGRFERLYRDYLTYCLEDRQLSEEELADIAHLKRLLAIAPESAAAIHDLVARSVYRRTVAEVLEDGVIDAAESAFLAQLQQELALPARTAYRIVESERRLGPQRTEEPRG